MPEKSPAQRLREKADSLLKKASGKNGLKLNLFNLFWIFTVCSVLGLIVETAYVFLFTGHYQDRAGLLYGPFSPIYGLGAVIMTLALNRFRKSNIAALFLASALLGGAFEYLVSLFLESAFGIVAWDYTGKWLSLDGRTCGGYMVFWGILGCAWIKLLLPRLLKLVNAIPWHWGYGLTAVCAMLMLANACMTFAALDCWHLRESGVPPHTAVEQFMANHYDNAFMENRFQTMDIHVGRAAHEH